MTKLFTKFRKDEEGAVTVDWVVLCAAVCALAGIAYVNIRDGASTLTSNVGSQLGGATPALTIGTEGGGEG